MLGNIQFYQLNKDDDRQRLQLGMISAGTSAIRVVPA